MKHSMLHEKRFLAHKYTSHNNYFLKSKLFLCSDNVANSVRSVLELTSACLHEHEVCMLKYQMMSIQYFTPFFPTCQ